MRCRDSRTHVRVRYPSVCSILRSSRPYTPCSAIVPARCMPVLRTRNIRCERFAITKGSEARLNGKGTARGETLPKPGWGVRIAGQDQSTTVRKAAWPSIGSSNERESGTLRPHAALMEECDEHAEAPEQIEQLLRAGGTRYGNGKEHDEQRSRRPQDCVGRYRRSHAAVDQERPFPPAGDERTPIGWGNQ